MISHGFVELGSKQNARLVTTTTKSRGLKVPGFDGVTVKRENTLIDRNRNWAPKKAEQMINDDARAAGNHVEKKWGKDRGIEIAGIPAFVQPDRYAKGGEFICQFAGLRLPSGVGEAVLQHSMKSFAFNQ